MINDDPLPRTITADEVQVGDEIELESQDYGITSRFTLTVHHVNRLSGNAVTSEGGYAYIGRGVDKKITLLSRPEPKTYAQIAYEAFAERVGWVTTWGGHGDNYRAAWEAAVDKAIAEHAAPQGGAR